MIRYIFFDFNGTILDDVALCLKLLNQMLRRQHKKELTLEEYKNVFTFPVKTYYERAGLDFSIDSFECLAEEFITQYQPASMRCGLYEGLTDTLSYLKEKGYHLVILSASEIHNLLEQCRHYKLLPYFDAILGIDNIHASGKMDIAADYLHQQGICGEEVLLVGDTLHDLEVANGLKASCMLVSCGHQSKEVLSKGKVRLLPSVWALKKIF